MIFYGQVSFENYLAIKYITTDTPTPDRTMRIQTFVDNGDRNANRLTDFLGDFTYKILIPVKNLKNYFNN